MLLAMCLSIIFILLDILSVVGVFKDALPLGINPFWKVSDFPVRQSYALELMGAL
jgi:hypothetical protein